MPINPDDQPGNDALRGAWTLYRLIFGPLAWPVVLTNAAALAWCYWQAF
jgi:hypothetical protein